MLLPLVTRCSESYVASRRFIHAVKCAERGVLNAESASEWGRAVIPSRVLSKYSTRQRAAAASCAL